jgi:guanosine-3',5'-bis(diphosphate) 3'-pyrophosphohydrolase
MSTPLLYTKSIDEEQEKKLILREYRALLRSLKHRIKKGDKKIIRRAFELAADAHKEMRRKSGEPYILHPLAVARIVVEEIGLGVTSACCALMHDVVEDTEITLEDISNEFGTEFSKIIDGLTKISNVVDIKASASMQAENFRKILLTLAEDPRVILIKLADRLHNMRTLTSMSRDKQLKIASETTYIFTPLAHRLGLYEIKTELEDLALKYTQPDIYLDIVRRLKETKRDRTRYINEFIKPVKEELQKHQVTFNIYGRPKSIHSIWNKMRTKHVTFDEVYDLFAIRIIIDAPQELEKEICWKAYSIITNIYQPSPERLRDWLSVPKSNGYEALHTTVMGPGGRWVEVQIRSNRMNEIAEKGLAAHWKYKEGRTTESKLDAWLKHIGEVLNNPDTDTLDFVQDFKLDLFTEEIYVYTPKGDMRVLPKGATALDLAFDVHSELGARCIGAKINYKLAPISNELSSGDQVEIITSSKQKPNEDWLKFVVTAKAKSRIKYYLREEKRNIGEDGKDIFNRKLDHIGLRPSVHNVNEVVSHFKYSSPLDLYYAIAVGAVDLKILKSFTINGDKFYQPQKEKLHQEVRLPQNIISAEQEKALTAKGAELIIFGESSDKILYKLAQCCQPIPGDDVFGFVSSGEGLKIHRTDCPNAAQLMANYAHRVVKTKWAINKEISFLTGVRLTGLDDVGIIQGITHVVSGELKMNMRSISIDSRDGVFDGTIMIFVRDREELDELCKRLGKIKGITKVERIDAIEE